jgi:hypothetical protein
VKNNEQKAKENEQTREAHKASEEITAERQRTKETVVIAGDSIIKYVKGWEVSNTDRNVIVTVSLSQVQQLMICLIS